MIEELIVFIARLINMYCIFILLQSPTVSTSSSSTDDEPAPKHVRLSGEFKENHSDVSSLSFSYLRLYFNMCFNIFLGRLDCLETQKRFNKRFQHRCLRG